MCGLIGYSGQANYNLDKIKFLMLWNSVERGKNATGIYTPSSGLMKNNDSAGSFLFGKEIKQLIEDNQLIAHVRANTVGSNAAKNAHPFDTEGIVLAHNGTLIDYMALGTSYGMKFSEWDVDSQILAYGVNRAFTSETTLDNLNIETLSEYKGAAALLFYSKHLDKMFVFKDKERTLFYGYDEVGGMYISSIEESLKALSLFEIQKFEDNNLYIIDHGDILKKVVYKTYAELHIHEFTGKSKGREKNQRFPKLGKNTKTINTAGDNFKAYWFMGLYLLCDTQQWGYSGYRGSFTKRATVKVGRFYRVTGWYDEKARIVEVIDENKEKAEVPLTCFNLSYCIPQESDLYRILHSINANQSNELIWEKGDIAMVSKLGYDILDGTLSLWSDKFNKGYWLDTKYCEPLTDDETLKNWDSLTPEEKRDGDENDDVVVEAEIVSQDIIDHIDTSSQTETITEEDLKLDDMIDTRIYLGVLDEIENEVSSIQENYSINKNISNQLNDLKNNVVASKTPSYINSLVIEN